jgi:hypothetical protein
MDDLRGIAGQATSFRTQPGNRNDRLNLSREYSIHQPIG